MSSFKVAWHNFKVIFRINSRIYPWNWSRRTPVSRVGIGARNPYAMYRSMYLEDPFTPQNGRGIEALPTHIDPITAREYLGKLCVVDDCNLPYEKLFDPKYGSCLFCKETIQEAHRLTHHKKEKEIGSVRLIISDGSPVDDHNSSQRGNLVGAPGGVCTIDHWDPNPQNPPPPPPYDAPTSLCQPWLDQDTRNPGFPDEVHPAYDDPLQGSNYGCYFIAALSSIAWFFSNYPPGKASQQGAIVRDPWNPIQFRKNSITYSLSGSGVAPNPTTTGVNTDYTLPKKSDDTFAAAKPKSGASSWVPYYEKTFARYLETIGDIDPPSPIINQPKICAVPCGDPGETLRALMLKDSIERYIMDIDDPEFDSNNPTTVWNKLSGSVAERLSIPVYNNARKTKVPAVARTYITAPAGCDYDTDLIVAAHAYSLLGIIQYNLTDKYVILRNPWGENPGYDYSSQYRPDHTLKYTLIGNVGETIDPITGPFPDAFSVTFPTIKVNYVKYSLKLWEKVTTSTGQEVYLPNKGRFAIHINDFVKYFSEFDYVNV